MPLLRAIDRSTTWAAAGRHEQALTIIKEALALSPDDPVVLLSLGKLYLHMERYAQAEEVFRAANKIKPSARLCVMLAQILIVDGRLSEAGRLLDQAHGLDPRHGGVYLAKGTLLTAQGRPQDALAAFRRAQEVDPYRATREAQRRTERLEEFLRKMSQP